MLIYNPITMSEVLKMEVFRDAKLVAGEEGLNKEVSWIHPLEIWDDPKKWIDGGELIFCCALGVNDEETLISFFQQVLQKGVAGFCLQLHAHLKNTPSRMIEVANHYHCPLIIFEQSVRFIDISRSLLNTLIMNVNPDYLREKQVLEENHWMTDWFYGRISNDSVRQRLKMDSAELTKFSYFSVLMSYHKEKVSHRHFEGVYLSLAKKLRAYFESEQFLFYPLFADGLLAGVVLDYGVNSTWKDRFYKVVKEVNADFLAKGNKDRLVLAAGQRSNHIEDIPWSYRTAMETIDVCQRFHIGQSIYDDLNLFFLFSLIDDAGNMERLQQYTSEHLSPLIEADYSQNGKLINTLKCYYEYNGNKQLTAQKLGISRRTLYYRLEQIEEILGTDPLLPKKRLMIEISFVLQDYFKNEGS